MTGFVSIQQVMQHMNNGLPFSIVYVTYNHTSGRGGSVKRIDMATKCWAKNTEAAAPPISPAAGGTAYFTRNPNHFNNSTVNIRVSVAGQADIRKVHIQLIRQFNGAIVK